MDQLILTRARGNRYLSTGGKWLVDFSSGGFGNGSPALRTSVARQAELLCLSSRNFFNESLALFCMAVAERLPAHQSIFPCNSFDEALDGALKLAKGARPGRSRVVVLGPAPRSRTFYGSRLNPLLHRQTWNQSGFLVDHIAWNDAAAIQESVGTACYAVVASRGVGLQLEDNYCMELREACDAAGAVLIANEEETGLGALGNLTSLDAIQPDVYVFGAALGGILPFATYASRKSLNDQVYKHRDPVLHATTTGGNPLGCVAACAVLEQIDAQDLYANASAIGERVGQLFKPLKLKVDRRGLLSVAGSHLSWELHFADRAVAQALVVSARDGGLLLVDPVGDEAAIVRLRIPLTTSESELVDGLQILADLIAASSGRVSAVA